MEIGKKKTGLFEVKGKGKGRLKWGKVKKRGNEKKKGKQIWQRKGEMLIKREN